MESGQKSLAQLALEQKTPKYVTLEVGSKISGYTPDFLDRLCRLNKVKYRLWNGNKHVIELESLLNETHSIIPSFEGLDLIDESDTTLDTSASMTPLSAASTVSAPLSSPAIPDTPSGTSSVSTPVAIPAAPIAPESTRLNDSASPISVPIESNSTSTIVKELRPIGLEKAKAMLGYAAASSRRRVGESRVGEFSFVGRSVVSDPDHPEVSTDVPDVSIPVPIVAAEMEEKKREEGIVAPPSPPLPGRAASSIELTMPGPTPPAPITAIPIVPQGPTPHPSVSPRESAVPVAPTQTSVVVDDWDTLLLGGTSVPVAPAMEPAVSEENATPPPFLQASPAEPIPTPPAALSMGPTIAEPVPPASFVPSSALAPVDIVAEGLPPRADLGEILVSMMPPGVIESAEAGTIAAPEVPGPPAVPMITASVEPVSAAPLFPPLSRPTPLSVEPLDMFPKRPVVESPPPLPARPPFPELTPAPVTLPRAAAVVPPPPVPAAVPETHPSVLGTSPLRSPAFNAAAALVLLAAAFGLALVNGLPPAPEGQTANIGSAFPADRHDRKMDDLEAAARAAFSDEIIVTPGPKDGSVVVTPIFKSGPGNAFEYMLVQVPAE